jgi:hypothetical protein
VLLVEHGKRCTRCAKGGLQKAAQGVCPLVNWDSSASDVKTEHSSTTSVFLLDESDEITPPLLEQGGAFAGKSVSSQPVLVHCDLQGGSLPKVYGQKSKT